MDAMTGYTEFCTHAVAQRQATPTDDLMSVLVHAEVDGDRLAPTTCCTSRCSSSSAATRRRAT